MSVQNTARNTQVEIARAKLISGAISLLVLAGSCAPVQMQSAKAEAAPAPVATATR